MGGSCARVHACADLHLDLSFNTKGTKLLELNKVPSITNLSGCTEEVNIYKDIHIYDIHIYYRYFQVAASHTHFLLLF